MKYTGMFLLGFVVLIGGVLGALWKTGVLASVGTSWTIIGVVVALGLGIMFAVANSRGRSNIEISGK